jgi:hypothetical protein
MRLAILKSSPVRIVYFGLAALLLLSLALLGSSGSSKQTLNNKVPLSSKIQGENETPEGGSSLPTVVSENQKVDGNQTSSSTSVHVSVNSNTTNGETTGSSSVEVTTNGQTQTFSDALDDCIAGGDIRIRVGGTRVSCESDDGKLEINWRSDTKQRTKSKTKIETDVDQDISLH